MPGKPATREQRKRQEQAVDWVFRNSEPDQTAAETAAFHDWLNSAPDNRRIYAEAERLMGEARIAIQSDPALRDFEVGRRRSAKPILGLAVGLLLAGSLFFLFDGPMRLQADLIAGTGETPAATLADGTSVRLNASSAIAYDFDGKSRTVRLLRGEAFFQVAADQNRPFTVVVGDLRVTALGTAFDVRLGEGETDVTVTQHAVRLEAGEGDPRPLRVEQGQQAAYDHATRRSTVRRTDGLVALAWQRGQMVVDNAPLSDIVEEMSRHFPGRIIVAGDDLARRRISGTLAVSDTSAALTFLERALGVTVTRLGPLIIIRN